MTEDADQRATPRFDALANDLHVAGAGFLRLGLDHMHGHAWAQGPWCQPAVANMAIGTELLCKAFLAGENPFFVFDRVQPDAAWAIHRSGFGQDKVPYERMYTLMEAGGSRTIGLRDCISLLQARYPDRIAKLGEWGRRLAGWRGVCVHFVLPDLETRATQRVAFAALSLAIFLSTNRKDVLLRFTPSDADNQFLARFDKGRAQDLDRRIVLLLLELDNRETCIRDKVQPKRSKTRRSSRGATRVIRRTPSVRRQMLRRIRAQPGLA